MTIGTQPVASAPAHAPGSAIAALRRALLRCWRPASMLSSGVPAELLDRAAVGFGVLDDRGRWLSANATLAQWLAADDAALDDAADRAIAASRRVGSLALLDLDPAAVAARGTPVALTTPAGTTIDIWLASLSPAERSPFTVVARLRPPGLTSREGGEEPARSLERFFSDAPVGIAVVDSAGTVLRANRALGSLFGGEPDALVGGQLGDWLDPADRSGILAKLAAAAQRDGEPVALEIHLAPPRERTMVMLSRFAPAEAAAGVGQHLVPIGGRGERKSGIDGIALYFIDVTERKQLEAQFAQSLKMQAVGQLAGGVAHDFNNLLTAMIGFCDLLLLRSRPGDPTFADLMQIKQNANRAANLVRQLLAFSRQQALQPHLVDVGEVLVELSHLLRRLIGENIELDVVHGRDLGLVEVDQGQLEQVVINLAVNARDAMAQGGRLTIRTENTRLAQPVLRGHETMPAGDYVAIEIGDTGIGIAPEHLGRIFEPFFSTKAPGSGTGLGLSTVYGIVKQTGGFVFVDSVRGTGTRFSIYLPRHPGAPGAAAPSDGEGEARLLRDLTGSGRIVLVEDDDAVRMFGARALRNKGYQVVEAKSGEAALDLIRTAAAPIDVLITDVVMPQMDGPSLAREARALDPAIKVIFISGYAEEAFRQRLDRDPDIAFLAKPFTLKEFAAKVKEVTVGIAGCGRSARATPPSWHDTLAPGSASAPS